VNTEQVRRAFLVLMQKDGKPLERVSGNHHGLAQVYRMPSGKTVRLYCNDQGAVMMTPATPGDNKAKFKFESEDYLGIAFPGEDGKTVVGYLVPSREAGKRVRDEYARQLEKKPDTKLSKMRILNFSGSHDRPRYGFQSVWSKYRVGELEVGAVPERSAVAEVTARCRREIAAAAGVPEGAVDIQVRF
jgi:hypothetical protein